MINLNPKASNNRATNAPYSPEVQELDNFDYFFVSEMENLLPPLSQSHYNISQLFDQPLEYYQSLSGGVQSLPRLQQGIDNLNDLNHQDYLITIKPFSTKFSKTWEPSVIFPTYCQRVENENFESASFQNASSPCVPGNRV